jgi:hypothetical protein
MQLHPLITIKYEEDHIDLSGATTGSDWWWIEVAGRMYLVDPRRAVWYSPSLVRTSFCRTPDSFPHYPIPACVFKG